MMIRMRVSWAIAAVCIVGCKERVATPPPESVTPSVVRDARPLEPVDAGTGDAGIDWVRLPGGTFQVQLQSGADDNGRVQTVHITSFEIARTEVTVAQYRACVDAGACTPPIEEDYVCNWDKRGRDEHPLNCLEWQQARQFVRWIGARLPSQTQWEWAARSGGRDQLYPWGNEAPSCRHVKATVLDRPKGCKPSPMSYTAPVCSYPLGNTAQGLCDMTGNVSEWVADSDGPDIQLPSDGSAWVDPDELEATYRGSSFQHYWRNLSVGWRSSGAQGSSRVGFRPVRSLRAAASTRTDRSPAERSSSP